MPTELPPIPTSITGWPFSAESWYESPWPTIVSFPYSPRPAKSWKRNILVEKIRKHQIRTMKNKIPTPQHPSSQHLLNHLAYTKLPYPPFRNKGVIASLTKGNQGFSQALKALFPGGGRGTWPGGERSSRHRFTRLTRRPQSTALLTSRSRLQTHKETYKCNGRWVKSS